MVVGSNPCLELYGVELVPIGAGCDAFSDEYTVVINKVLSLFAGPTGGLLVVVVGL